MSEPRCVLVTGGAGFIGANLVRHWLATTRDRVVVIDKLSYAGHRESLPLAHPRLQLVVADIADGATLRALLAEARPRAILHLAAESHVDRSLAGPAAFVHSNIVGTATLLEETTAWWRTLPAARRARFRWLQVSTDEVYGVAATGTRHRETSRHAPNSPYAASKAAADHLVRAWHRSHGLPTLTTHGSNTYGPLQQPEKLIPLAIARALAGETIPLYGDGRHARDWLHVDDHVRALQAVLAHGEPGGHWCIGSGRSRENRAVLATLCATLDRLRPRAAPHARLIRRVADRPGHDRRYAVDARRLRALAGWSPSVGFAAGLAATVRWYLDHPDWLAAASGPVHQRWLQDHYKDADTRRRSTGG